MFGASECSDQGPIQGLLNGEPVRKEEAVIVPFSFKLRCLLPYLYRFALCFTARQRVNDQYGIRRSSLNEHATQ